MPDLLLKAGKCLLVLLMSSFVPITCVSFFRFRLQKKRREYKNVIETLGITGTGDPQLSVEAEYSPRDYILPIIFATFVCILGFGFLLFAADVLQVNQTRPNVFLTGIVDLDADGIRKVRWQSSVILVFAFLGAFTWSAQNIVRRLITADLTPSTYYAAGLRMIFAACLALLLSWPLRSAGEAASALPGIAFLAGILPEQAFIYLKEKIGLFSKTKDADALDLGMIEGLNLFHKVKLSELGIDNSQNLAEANLIDLLLRSSFSTCQLIDWILQAKLHVHFKDDIAKIRSAGVRTAVDFQAKCATAEQQSVLAQHTQIPEIALKIIHESLKQDASIAALADLRRRVNTYRTGATQPAKSMSAGT
jgi:hypothetical protein